MSEPQQTSDGRWAAIYEAMTGASAPGGHADMEKVGAEPEAVTAGHEADKFDAFGIIMVPVLITVITGFTYLVITLVFGFFKPGEVMPTANTNPQAASDNAKEWNERVAKISSSDDNAKVKQPRLEWVRAVEKKANDPRDAASVSYRSFAPTEKGNAPEITPQYLRAENYVDWKTGERTLVDYKWVDKAKGLARIPVEEAMKAVIEQKKLPAKAGSTAPAGTLATPKLSNGGQAVAAPPAEVPAGPKKDDAHKGGH